MKTFFYRVLVLVITAMSSASVLPAQSDRAEPPVLFRTLALGESIDGVFYEVRPGKAVALSAARGGFSAAYESPEGGRVQIYREVPPIPPETKPRRVPVAEAQLGKGGPWLLMLVTSPDSRSGEPKRIQAVAVDDSWDVHPVKTIRVINYLRWRARAAVKIGGSAVEVPAGQSQIFSYPGESEESWVQVAVLEDEGWVMRASEPKATFAKTRSTLILSHVPPTREEPTPRGVVISSLIEIAPKPPAGPVTVAQSGRR
ncbi:MAG: hypothetical protein K0R17_1171 [Rariglobus sp.]|jgi:hypothetical protein|nr:hypothetical protein [Rariglobus sp.]